MTTTRSDPAAKDRLILALVQRVYEQSELLSRAAERARPIPGEPMTPVELVEPRKCPCVKAEHPVEPCVDCWHFSNTGERCIHCGQSAEDPNQLIAALRAQRNRYREACEHALPALEAVVREEPSSGYYRSKLVELRAALAPRGAT